MTLLFGSVFATFVVFYAVPSDPARVILGPNASQADVDALRQELGMDAGLPTQFARFTWRLAKLDLGSSFTDGRRVAPEIGQKMRVSLTLISISLVIVFVYVLGAVVLGFVWESGLPDAIDFLLVSTPTMFSAVLIGLLAFNFYGFTSFSGNVSSLSDFLVLLPAALALALYPMAILSRIARNELRRLSMEPFATTALAYGADRWRQLTRHLFRHALLPCITALSNMLPMLFTGAFVVEVVFSVPAIGTLLVKSLLQRDLPMLQGIVLVNACVVVALHFLLELLIPIIDPRAATDDP